jgi:hypothetical protein
LSFRSGQHFVNCRVIVGNPSTFAIESGITKAFDRPSFRALGFFVIHVGDRRYGVHAPEATLLACSFDEVQDRIARRGSHTTPFAHEPDAGRIADAYRDSIYAPDQENELFFGLPQPEFCHLIYSKHIVWAPDGDEAFDDGSHVLHFDIGDRVRLIAFRSMEDGYHHDPDTITDVCIDAAEFYRILKQWRDAFQAAWKIAPRTAV